MSSTPAHATAEALAARGAPITLVDGSTVQLRYTMASLIALEEDFGNVARVMSEVRDGAAAIQVAFAEASGSTDNLDVATRARAATAPNASIFKTLVRALAPGLLDVAVDDPRTGERIWLGEHHDAVARLLDMGQLQAYMNAFGRAFNQAFDTGAGGAVPPGVPQDHRLPTDSRGTRGGTSPSGKGATRPTRSGG